MTLIASKVASSGFVSSLSRRSGTWPSSISPFRRTSNWSVLRPSTMTKEGESVRRSGWGGASANMVDNIDNDGTTSSGIGGNYDNSNSNNSNYFTIIPQVIDGETRFGVGVHPSELYQPTGMVLPKLPIYHPYHPLNNCITNAENEDIILQVPLAMILPSFDDLHSSSLVPPRELLDFIAKQNKNVNYYTSTQTTYYIIVQTLPYTPQTRIICRYQYALFPQAKSQMKGKESIWTQSIIYNHHRDNDNDNNTAERIRYPPTSIKIYESNKDSANISPTILCGNSMVLDTVENLCGNAIWSHVVGSSTDTTSTSPPPMVDFDNGVSLVNIHSYIGLTYFLPNDEYDNFVREIQDKQSPVDIINWITILIEKHKKL